MQLVELCVGNPNKEEAQVVLSITLPNAEGVNFDNYQRFIPKLQKIVGEIDRVRNEEIFQLKHKK